MRPSDKSRVTYANQWGNAATWYGRLLYSTPEQAEKWEPKEWLDFCAAVGAQLGEVCGHKELFDVGDAHDLRQLLSWAMCKWHRACEIHM